MHSEWLLATLLTHSTTLRADSCVWPLKLSHLTMQQVNCQSLSLQAKLETVPNPQQAWLECCLHRVQHHDSRTPAQDCCCWVTLLLCWETALGVAREQLFSDSRFPSVLSLLSRIVGLLISQKWKGKSKTELGKSWRAGLKQEPWVLTWIIFPSFISWTANLKRIMTPSVEALSTT